MKYQKKVLGTLEKCYAVAPLRYRGEDCFLVAAEKHERCLLFDAAGAYKETVWEGPGGVMSMVQIPGSDGAFLATHCFYSPNDSANAKIVMAYPKESGWQVKTIADLPFVHRFTILSTKDANYIVAATLKSAHAYTDDWTCPGRIWVTKLPETVDMLQRTEPLQFTAIQSGLYKNHGFFQCCDEGVQKALFGTQNGVYRVTPPQAIGETWLVERIMGDPTSDMALIDLDGDGVCELVTYSPFHGETLAVYKSTASGYRKVYTYPEPLKFLHAICAGVLNGIPTLLVGYRQGRRELCALTYDNGYKLTTIDSNAGPANVIIFKQPGADVIVAANRETDEIAMYVQRGLEI